MRHNLFDDIMQNIDIDDVPLEFIVVAKVTSKDGTERLIRGSELEKVIRGPERKRLVGFNAVLDTRKIRNVVVAGVNEIYDELNKLCEEQWSVKKDTDK